MGEHRGGPDGPLCRVRGSAGAVDAPPPPRTTATATPTRSADATRSRPTSSTADSDRCGGRPLGPAADV